MLHLVVVVVVALVNVLVQPVLQPTGLQEYPIESIYYQHIVLVSYFIPSLH